MLVADLKGNLFYRVGADGARYAMTETEFAEVLATVPESAKDIIKQAFNRWLDEGAARVEMPQKAVV